VEERGAFSEHFDEQVCKIGVGIDEVEGARWQEAEVDAEALGGRCQGEIGKTGLIEWQFTVLVLQFGKQEQAARRFGVEAQVEGAGMEQAEQQEFEVGDGKCGKMEFGGVQFEALGKDGSPRLDQLFQVFSKAKSGLRAGFSTLKEDEGGGQGGAAACGKLRAGDAGGRRGGGFQVAEDDGEVIVGLVDKAAMEALDELVA